MPPKVNQFLFLFKLKPFYQQHQIIAKGAFSQE